MLNKHRKIKGKCKYILKSLEIGEENEGSHVHIVAVLHLPQRMDISKDDDKSSCLLTKPKGKRYHKRKFFEG